LIPVGDHSVRLKVQSPLDRARLVDERKAGALLYEQKDAPGVQVAAKKHPLGRTVNVERFE
jgi:hypothetical protein